MDQLADYEDVGHGTVTHIVLDNCKGRIGAKDELHPTKNAALANDPWWQ